jgi:hypothetical protein
MCISIRDTCGISPGILSENDKCPNQLVRHVQNGLKHYFTKIKDKETVIKATLFIFKFFAVMCGKSFNLITTGDKIVEYIKTFALQLPNIVTNTEKSRKVDALCGYVVHLAQLKATWVAVFRLKYCSLCLMMRVSIHYTTNNQLSSANESVVVTGASEQSGDSRLPVSSSGSESHDRSGSDEDEEEGERELAVTDASKGFIGGGGGPRGGNSPSCAAVHSSSDSEEEEDQQKSDDETKRKSGDSRLTVSSSGSESYESSGSDDEDEDEEDEEERYKSSGSDDDDEEECYDSSGSDEDDEQDEQQEGFINITNRLKRSAPAFDGRRVQPRHR